jgi:hypothetical protein
MNPLPNGLRMIAGSAKATGPQEHMDWTCLNGTAKGNLANGRSATILRCADGDQLEMNIEFPQCWDGENLDSSDHKSHMAYGIGWKNGNGCPDTHPVPVPTISFHIRHPIKAGADVSGWRLSSDTYDAGQPGGYSIHGDWWDGWDESIKKAWTDGCSRKPVSCFSDLLGDGRSLEGDI